MTCNMEKLKNFSDEKQKLIALCIDSYTGDIANYVSANVDASEKSLDNEIRNRIEKEILKGEKWGYRTYRKYKNDIFAIIEVVLDQTIPEGWADNEWFDRFVEVIRVDLGDKNEFYAEDASYLTVSKFSGNHWDTNRERLDVGSVYTVPTYWWDVHFYNEFERFMKNIDSFARMMDKARRSFTQAFQNATYTAFAGIGDYIPATFKGNGALSNGTNLNNFMTIADKVGVANGNATVTIVGTKAALRNLQSNLDANWIAASAKEERKRNGIVSDWEGYSLMVLPQVFNPGTFTYAIDDNQIFLIANRDGERMIKFVYEGDSRIKEVQDIRENMDQTLEAQIQTKAGVAVIASGIVGVWNLA